jgi:hypothetical protein
LDIQQYPQTRIDRPQPGSKEANGLPATQLYELAADIGETSNVYAENLEVVVRMTRALEEIIAKGRSTPGPKQSNDAPIQVRKGASAKAEE